MIRSLTFRIAALGIIVAAAMMALVILLVDASDRTNDSFHSVTHSAEVIETMDEALSELRDAESGQRGFVLTHDPSFARYFEDRIVGSRRAIDRVILLTVDNPLQNARARELRGLVDLRAKRLSETLDLAKSGAFDAAERIIASGKGRDLMTSVTTHAQSFLVEENALQARRVDYAGTRLSAVKRLALIGGPIIALLKLLVSGMLIRGIRRPARAIGDAMAALGEGDKRARITDGMGSAEFEQLARGYNAMADHLESAVTDQIRSETELRRRGEIIEMLSGMAHRMQAARTDDELAEVIRVFVPRVLPGIPGALYTHNNSRNLLVPITGWGGFDAGTEGFSPEQCWALRRGQSHFVDEPGSDIVCAHVGGGETVYQC
jgi:CHASE3 domain sensor protein